MRRRSPFLLLALAITAASVEAAEPLSKADEAFRAAVDGLFENHRGDVAAAVKNLETGWAQEWDAGRAMPTASLIKLPIMVEAYRQIDAGKLALDLTVPLTEVDKVPGSGVLTGSFSAGATMPLRDAIHLMIVYSDNTATNLVLDRIGLPATNAFTAGFGCPNTQVHAKVYRRDTSVAPERSAEFGLGSTTPGEMVRILESLHNRQIANPASCDAMIGHLRACEDRSKVRRYLADATVANKTGAVSAARTDAGVIETDAGPVAYCILTANNEDRSWGDANEAELLCAEFGRLVYRHVAGDDDASAPPVARVLRIGDDGDLVASLQRTLNSHAKAEDRIAADGDFGPNTQRAVKRFQTAQGLEATGVVDMTTWRALGPLVSADEAAVIDVEELNSQPLDTADADPLDGPPIVTCKAYAIADGQTGELLWGMNESGVRDPASVTKLMTAHLVTRLAESDPAVLDELIVASQKAADTAGSSAELMAGDRVSVRDALYGLMLPSGNDMSVAIAQHFGARANPDAADASDDALADFVAAMNAEAKRLGMGETGYRNPHGLTAEGHHTSARDMAKLVFAAMKSPLLRDVVATRRLAINVDSVSGYQRSLVWSNSNRLLRFDGFDGVKTGTTGPAGACLTSTGVRDGKRLIVVVLGSSCSDARYVDSRNLYRWAWLQLRGHNGG